MGFGKRAGFRSDELELELDIMGPDLGIPSGLCRSFVAGRGERASVDNSEWLLGGCSDWG